jgi:pantoate--beta-alanine ligase
MAGGECGAESLVTMRVLETIAAMKQQMKAWRQAGKSVGLVPTMGYFHEGHLSLMRQARAENDAVVVSLFVNPTQFGPHEDLERYPRDFAQDCRKAEALGVDVLFAPTAEEMYPPGYCTYVHVEGLTDSLCGASRPGHFRGVATVVLKLFHIIPADRAYFGEKDFQQLRVIQRMVADLNLDVEIIPMPIVREPDGVAMSSRNAYLNPAERQAAGVLYRALQRAQEAVAAGERDARKLQQAVTAFIRSEPLARIDYVAVVDPQTLEEVSEVAGPTLLALAVHIGPARLIDNVMLHPAAG